MSNAYAVSHYKWTLDAARKSKYITKIIVSTDDKRIIKTLPKQLVDIRPEYLCRDDVSSEAVVKYCLDEKCNGKKYDYVILLQPTSPLRTTADIDNMIECAMQMESLSMVSVYRLTKPIFGGHTKDVYILNGAMYLISPSIFDSYESLCNPQTQIYVMPEERSIDIDTEFDFMVAEMLMKKQIKCR